MEKLGWKILAIICMTLLVLETVVIGWAVSYGIREVENEEMCVYEICDGADTYRYEDGICQCYARVNGVDEVLRTEVM